MGIGKVFKGKVVMQGREKEKRDSKEEEGEGRGGGCIFRRMDRERGREEVQDRLASLGRGRLGVERLVS